MSERITIFVNERPVSATAGASLSAIVAAGEPELAQALEAGQAYATDGVGRRVSGATVPHAGDIFRIVRSAPRAVDGGT